jgi:glc operon protein GlcG
MRARFPFALLAGFAVMASHAHSATKPLIVQVPQLSSDAAQRLVEACIAIGEKSNQPLAVAVVDPAGHLMHFHASEGASPSAPRTAELKAITAARWRRATGQLADLVRKGHAEPVYVGDFPIGGGVPIIQDGRTLGAIGVAGPGSDEGCAVAAVKAVFGNSVETGRAIGPNNFVGQ